MEDFHKRPWNFNLFLLLLFSISCIFIDIFIEALLCVLCNNSEYLKKYPKPKNDTNDTFKFNMTDEMIPDNGKTKLKQEEIKEKLKDKEGKEDPKIIIDYIKYFANFADAAYYTSDPKLKSVTIKINENNFHNWDVLVKIESKIYSIFDVPNNCLILKNDEFKKLVFAFPGTQTWAQILLQFLGSIAPRYYPSYTNSSNILINRYFGNRASEIIKIINSPEYSEDFKQIFNRIKDKYQIIFTGHSLGGAMAQTFFAFAQGKNYISKENNTAFVITYQQPRVGNYFFSKFVVKNVEVIIRKTNTHDYIKLVPSIFMIFSFYLFIPMIIAIYIFTFFCNGRGSANESKKIGCQFLFIFIYFIFIFRLDLVYVHAGIDYSDDHLKFSTFQKIIIFIVICIIFYSIIKFIKYTMRLPLSYLLILILLSYISQTNFTIVSETRNNAVKPETTIYGNSEQSSESTDEIASKPQENDVSSSGGDFIGNYFNFTEEDLEKGVKEEAYFKDFHNELS